MFTRIHRFTGLDLPVFDPERPLLWTPSEYMRAAEHPTDITFLRRTHSEKPTGIRWDTFLKWTDDELEKLAELTGGVALKHTWGLYDVSDKPNGEVDQSHPYYLPTGHVLSAEVNIVDTEDGIFDDTPEERDRFARGLRTYLYQHHGPRLRDVRPDQFLYGIQRDTGQTEQTYINVDIEPRRAAG